MWIFYNNNPESARVGDCTIRAIAKALGEGWEDTYIGVTVEGIRLHDMPSANRVWGAYLRYKGFTRKPLEAICPDCYTVADFAKAHPEGTYILALSGHVVCVIDGDWYDTWDSGEETPLYYWERRR